MFYAASASSPGGGRGSFWGEMKTKQYTPYAATGLRVAIGTVGWEPKMHPISIEKIDVFSRDCLGFVAGFVFAESPFRAASYGPRVAL
jgi:hypothetical protein